MTEAQSAAMIKDATDAIAFFPRAFTIILALALGEAFKQFVSDKAETGIQWNRLPALMAFLFMIFPFFHGMNRYFFRTYQDPLPAASYAGRLLFDSMMFMTEAALFFVMSRSLAAAQWKRFLIGMLVLLVVDTAWGSCELSELADIQYWIMLNVALGVVLIVLLAFFWARPVAVAAKTASGKETEAAGWPFIWTAVATFITTSLSYYLSWSFYFPPLPPPG